MGLGDWVMATAEARVAQESAPGLKVAFGDGVKAHWSEVFDHNPRIATPGEVTAGAPVTWLANYPGHRPYIDYDATLANGRAALLDAAPADRKRLLRAAGRWYWNAAYRAMPGEFYFSDSERSLAAIGRGRVVIAPSVKPGNVNKDWGLARWQTLAALLDPDIETLQVGPAGGPLLEAVTARAHTPSFRDACAILAGARLFVGTEGALHHAAAALGIPAVVIFGGYTAPSMTGYDGHCNLYVDGPESPCGRRRSCAHCTAAMAAIAPKRVAAHVLTLLDQVKG